MNVLGLKIISHDTGAALISNERVVAIAEERLNRHKHSPNMFPQMAIDYCLKEFDLKPEDIDVVVIDQVDRRDAWPMRSWFLERVQGDFSKARIEIINHHDAHAASAFFASPFEESAVLVYDGSGERFVTHLGVIANETESLYVGEGNKLQLLQKTLHRQTKKFYPYTTGIGKLYQLLSEHYLDMGPYNEGKMMGLAPYGKPSLFEQFPRNQWFTERLGHVYCNAQITYPGRALGTKMTNVKSLGAFVRSAYSVVRVRAQNVLRATSRVLGGMYYSETIEDPHFFNPIRLTKPARSKTDILPDEYYASVAYAGQKILEDVAVSWGKRLKLLTNTENLCIAGGVGLNIDANRNFIDTVGFKNLFVQPAASDTGIALGCALWGWHVVIEQKRFFVMRDAALGHVYSDESIRAALTEKGSEIEFKKVTDIAREAAQLLSEGKILGWHQGGGEYGPRALGHRSIVCDARGKDARDVLNNRVKHREAWRPFAASILKEKLTEWFELDTDSPATAFMLLAAEVKADKRDLVPSVVHVDNTCRMQTLTREANGRYYDLVKEFETITGIPLILNTSFNLGGEPMVETPADSIRCFLSTEMDYLVIEDYLIWKK